MKMYPLGTFWLMRPSLQPNVPERVIMAGYANNHIADHFLA